MARVALVSLLALGTGCLALGALRGSRMGAALGRRGVPDDASCYYDVDPGLGELTGTESFQEEGGHKGRSYRGLVSSTVSGRTCQNWISRHPWPEAASIAEEPDEDVDGNVIWGNGLGNHNYCRNPDLSMEGPWCFTMDTNEKHKKERCEIPLCPTPARDFQEQHRNTSRYMEATECECGEELYGSSRTTKDTAVPQWEGLLQHERLGRARDGTPCRCRARR